MKKGLVQMVVVYKLDRLSRSIMDFHHMMKEFEKYGCNFVSITQAFDTSTSMGVNFRLNSSTHFHLN
jgi:site-specific DNA recombinase